jgi:hypothetical protein
MGRENCPAEADKAFDAVVTLSKYVSTTFPAP